MLNKKLILYLENLDKTEWDALERYLMYSSKKVSKNALLLLQYLAPYYPTFNPEEKKLSVSYIAHKLFKHNEQKVHDSATQLLKKTKKWLAIHWIEQEDNDMSDYLFVRALAKRPTMHAEFMNNAQQFVTKTEANGLKDSDTLFQTFDVTYNQYLHTQTNRNTPENQLLSTSLAQLDHFYLITKLRIGIEQLCLRQSLLNEKSEVNYWAEHLERAKNSSDPLVQRYLLLYEIYDNPENSTLSMAELEHYFLHSNIVLSAADLDLFTTSLVNICNRFIKKGYSQYIQNIYSLYCFGIDNGIYAVNNHISFATFRNVTIILSKTKMKQEFDEFIIKYSPMLDENIQNSAVSLANAYFNLFQQNYNLVLEYVQGLSKSIMIIKINAYVLEIIALFEISLQDNSFILILEAKLNAFCSFLKTNNEWSAKKNEPYKNFYSLVNYFHQIRFNSSINYQTLIEKIESKQSILMRDWLKSIAQKLEK
jgi:hypothetical protein